MIRIPDTWNGEAASIASGTGSNTLQRRASHGAPSFPRAPQVCFPFSALLFSGSNQRGRDACRVCFFLPVSLSPVSIFAWVVSFRWSTQLIREAQRKPRITLTQIKDTIFKYRPFQIPVVLFLLFAGPLAASLSAWLTQILSYFYIHPAPSRMAVFLFPRVHCTQSWSLFAIQNIISAHSYWASCMYQVLFQKRDAARPGVPVLMELTF